MPLRLNSPAAGDTSADIMPLLYGRNNTFFHCENLAAFVAASGACYQGISTCQYAAALSGAPPQSEEASIRFEVFHFGGQNFRLRTPLVAQRNQHHGVWSYESPELSIFAVGKSQSDALYSFVEDFAALWNGIAQADDSALTGDAIDMKRTLLNLVESAE